MRTVICHFFNEEFLLPWWLNHHKKIFDHGIMIDYASTDRSAEIIKEICPTWEIHQSRNKFFDSAEIDREVEDYEATCTGWRMALNVTEFLYGNVQQLDRIKRKRQVFVGNFVFVAPESNPLFTHERPLHEQVTVGYFENDRLSIERLLYGARASRSLHNFAISYPPQGGRHFIETPTFKDLAIFYFGYAALSKAFIERKVQIKGKMSAVEIAARGDDHPNTVSQARFENNIEVHHRPRAIDLTPEINMLSRFQGYEPLPLAIPRPLISFKMQPPPTLKDRLREGMGLRKWLMVTAPLRLVKRARNAFRSGAAQRKLSFFYEKYITGLSVPSEPRLDEEGLAFLRKQLMNTKVFVEYGSGASTVLAAHLVPTIVSVESDLRFRDLLQKRISSLKLKSNVHLLHVDIGFTEDFGYPLVKRQTPERVRRWSEYPKAPWRELDALGVAPETVFIDGRFRVACALQTLLETDENCCILVDDYVGRTPYECITRYADLVALHGRMAEFKKKSDFDADRVVRDIEGFYRQLL